MAATIITETAGQKNAYVCSKLHVTHTVNADDGATPFMIACPVAACGTMARSMFYQVLPELIAPAYEFYAPNEAEIATLEGYDLQHVQAGGLLFRPLGGSPPVAFYAFDGIILAYFLNQFLAKMMRVMDSIEAVQASSGSEIFAAATMDRVYTIKDKISEIVSVMPPDQWAAILATVPPGTE